MSKLNKFRKSTEEESVWLSISDLMSGLMIVFLFIAVAFMSRVADENIEMKEQKATIEKVVQTYEETKGNIYYDLYEEFKNEVELWSMRIDKDGTISFIEPEVLFDAGKDEIKPQFKEILNSFFPRYINLVFNKYKDNVSEIRIEGHTSSEWSGGNTELDSYFANMKLSQDRTRNVLMHLINLNESQQYKDWLISKITANGMSYSQIILDEQGNEDKEKSRRVEFRIITNSDEIINEIINEYEEEE
ncbi:OmpA family protein [Clostridium sp. D43t1_170807_H7]|uniref:OmpA family protein n=1 Tax=Clostridium sp. D43t1_170807_H7 TaxID=2787140 RepID=UPI00189B418A|nr:OmpA family protein [Clostridium sp. D43t1_170807_H7]